MTREEAIDVLNNTSWISSMGSTVVDEAIELATEALDNWESVVRCKDCDRGKKTAVGYICTMLGASVANDGMGYCNNGRKK